MGVSASVPEKSIHEFTVKDSRGKDVELNDYKGKVLLVVNVASRCGFTDSNYTQLTDLYSKYKDRGFEILAFPCNQFLNQEPGSSEEAQEFACTRYKAEYPIFHKKSGFLGSRIKWNFTKFLINKDGQIVGRFGPTVAPLAIEVRPLFTL
ncbi:unnamed protein product [Linum tenue]|uniref:Glutathione peroxidase n=1 Tax=Linum tenue TaxID=586396 RepID=A0AAV0IGC7_9ROSI|nr:unnamed protein product [Linum tenue]